ncbi:MAG TPA: hypothetical protein VFJ57_07750 [Solirubrobacterales bacterium]|nr:hypothetical protein [Solirubrobacterales bacterium]
MRRVLTVAALGLAGVLIVSLLDPVTALGSDVWSNISPAAPLGGGGLFGRYPLDHYTLDQHFTAVSVSLTGGVDVSGVLPMIAYFFAGALWWLTCFLANALITLFAFAFSLDLVNGSQATGGAGALAPVSAAIHSIYANVFGGPWLVLAISVVGIWAMWRALVQRRYAETAGALGLSLIYVVLALFFVAQPGQTIGAASKWTNQMSEAFLAISDHGSPSGGGQAKDEVADRLFDLLVVKPWVVLDFGGLEHCVLAGTGDEDSDPTSAPVRPLSSSPAREGALARRLASGTEVSADGKVCVNNANKYAPHFLRFGLESDERDAEYDALDHGDSSKLPDADADAAGYRLGVADKPASDAMEAGGQYQRLLLALVIFVGELGAVCLLGSLSVGIILAQVLLLLLLAFSPVALVAAVIPGRGHAFFKGWLEKLAGYLLRKAAYSLILATLLAVNGALAGATAQLGWLMSFGLQALFFWAVFLQRKNLTESLIGIATGPGAPGRDNTLRLLALYAGARSLRRPLGGLRRSARAGTAAPARGAAALTGRDAPKPGTAAPAPRFGTSYSAPVGGGAPSLDQPGPSERRSRPSPAPKDAEPADRAAAPARRGRERGRRQGVPKGGKPRQGKAAAKPGREAKRAPARESEKRGTERQPAGDGRHTDAPQRQGAAGSQSALGAELREERERGGKRGQPRQPEREPRPEAPRTPPRRRRRWRRMGRGR